LATRDFRDKGFSAKGFWDKGFSAKGFWDKGFWQQRGFGNKRILATRDFGNKGILATKGFWRQGILGTGILATRELGTRDFGNKRIGAPFLHDIMIHNMPGTTDLSAWHSGLSLPSQLQSSVSPEHLCFIKLIDIAFPA
jgi:hypothetical protein